MYRTTCYVLAIFGLSLAEEPPVLRPSLCRVFTQEVDP